MFQIAKTSMVHISNRFSTNKMLTTAKQRHECSSRSSKRHRRGINVS